MATNTHPRIAVTSRSPNTLAAQATPPGGGLGLSTPRQPADAQRHARAASAAARQSPCDAPGRRCRRWAACAHGGAASAPGRPGDGHKGGPGPSSSRAVGAAVLASPYRPTPPPSRGFLNDLFPVNPMEVVGGLMGMGTQAAGDTAAYMGSHTPLDFLTPGGSAAPPGVQESANRLGRDITARLDMPTEHVGSAAAVPVVAAGAKLLPES